MQAGDLVKVTSDMWARCAIDETGVYGTSVVPFTTGELLVVIDTIMYSKMKFLKVLSSRGVAYIRQSGVVPA